MDQWLIRKNRKHIDRQTDRQTDNYLNIRLQIVMNEKEKEQYKINHCISFFFPQGLKTIFRLRNFIFLKWLMKREEEEEKKKKIWIFIYFIIIIHWAFKRYIYLLTKWSWSWSWILLLLIFFWFLGIYIDTLSRKVNIVKLYEIQKRQKIYIWILIINMIIIIIIFKVTKTLGRNYILFIFFYTLIEFHCIIYFILFFFFSCLERKYKTINITTIQENLYITLQSNACITKYQIEHSHAPFLENYDDDYDDDGG